jgi:preprotein translocase subunit YajC
MVLIILLILLAVMWVLLAVPRQREARRHNAVVASLVLGDEIMTGGGIYGSVVDIADDHILLEVAPGTVMKIARQAVALKIEPAIPPTATRPAGPADPGDTNPDSTVDAAASDHLED